MKNLMTVLAIAMAAFSVAAHAADAASAPTKQQSKMVTCSADFKATGKPGSERQAFMKDCLKKDTPQQEKMKSCNAEAKGKKGDERKAFMKECLKK
ncbi:MAG TPA: PsiF family protein [Albitalea sp.]|nr:PsiF family protein [Albitalea sp.]